METFYRRLKFRTRGPHAHRRIRDRIEALAGIEVLATNLRRLGFLERDELFGEEYACTLVVEVHVDRPVESTLDEVRPAPAADPYRSSGAGQMTMLHVDLGAIVDEIEAAHEVVTHAIARFETREYELSLCEQFSDTVAAACRERGAAAELRVVEISDSILRAHRLVGRIRGDVGPVNRVADVVRRSGYVADDAIRVDYA